MPNMGTTGTVNVTLSMLEQALRAIEDYRESVKGLNNNLKQTVEGLIPASFSGSAAEGFKAFYTNNIEPNINTNLFQMLDGLKNICEAIKAQIPGMDQGVDEQLGQVNKNPGGTSN